MPDPKRAESVSGSAERPPVVHLAARIEDRLHGLREEYGRRRGLTPIVVPFTGYGGADWIRVLGRVLLVHRRRAEAGPSTNIRGWRSFTSIPVRDAEVTVEVAGVRTVVRADRGGVVDARIPVDLPPGWHDVHLSVADGDRVTAQVFVADPAARFGMISDIDDTVMVTALPRPFLAAWNTFVLNEHARSPVPGMAVLYERVLRAHPGAPVVYLSTGAWNVAPTLTRFLRRNLYPTGPLLLTDWGPTLDRWFRSGQEHKRETLRRIAEEFPEVRWLLVGDDGQHDEELYGEFAAAHPENVAAVAIRQLTPGEAVLAGGRSAKEHPGDAEWHYAPDGAGLSDRLAAAGLL